MSRYPWLEVYRRESLLVPPSDSLAVGVETDAKVTYPGGKARFGSSENDRGFRESIQHSSFGWLNIV